MALGQAESEQNLIHIACERLANFAVLAPQAKRLGPEETWILLCLFDRDCGMLCKEWVGVRS